MPAVVFALAGAMKLSRTPQQLATSGLGWAEGFGSRPVKAIGAALVHGRRHESQMIAANVVLLAPTAAVVRDRVGSHAFQSLGPDGTPLRGAADDAPLHAPGKKITGP
ncbi:hypothetical protein [Streptomyces sp. NPDC056987]|uniref:hypothetical protein n=1 Tax=Streptomyces sp. NPDC056987 TaxID=3345988 RepID=UPI00363D0D36